MKTTESSALNKVDGIPSLPFKVKSISVVNTGFSDYDVEAFIYSRC